jgi:hypothetical protein
MRHCLDEQHGGGIELIAAFFGHHQTAFQVVFVRQCDFVCQTAVLVFARAALSFKHRVYDRELTRAALVIARVKEGIMDEIMRRRLRDRIVNVSSQPERTNIEIRPQLLSPFQSPSKSKLVM